MLDYEGAKCGAGDPLEIINEGFGICESSPRAWFVWSWVPQTKGWDSMSIKGRSGDYIPAWLHGALYPSRDEAVAFIEAEMSRERPVLSEEQERARLMPV